ncbi:ABC transporter permease [Aquabacterium olei]|jgi:putative spermidine/putrescine transport system permease protein|uniref:Polyamine ABC transporter permease n=1 Tax=Aquabacterium olei TaxID=1296669 RepID=A0A2U8FUU8_9BURK|nr:ABC transporter permease [Aquabacterium olei]AWI54842.1 polyamine ABC transporter permease [Aquabacterium olei]
MLPAYASRVEQLWHVTLRVIVAAVLLFLVAPLLVIVPLSFNADSFLLYPMTGFSLRWYEELMTSGTWTHAFRNSLIVAPLATLLAMVLGTMAAIGLTRIDFPGKSVLTAILISPMVVPVVIVGVATYLFFAPIGLTGNFFGLVIVHAALGVPFVVTTVSATLQGFDMNLVRAAASLGASPLYTFFKVTLPLVAPGVISGGLFAFGTSFDEVVVTLFLASPEQTTLPRQMFAGIRENISPAIAAVATILTVMSVLMLLTLEWLRGRNAAARGT